MEKELGNLPRPAAPRASSFPPKLGCILSVVESPDLADPVRESGVGGRASGRGRRDVCPLSPGLRPSLQAAVASDLRPARGSPKHPRARLGVSSETGPLCCRAGRWGSSQLGSLTKRRDPRVPAPSLCGAPPARAWDPNAQAWSSESEPRRTAVGLLTAADRPQWPLLSATSLPGPWLEGNVLMFGQAWTHGQTDVQPGPAPLPPQHSLHQGWDHTS